MDFSKCKMIDGALGTEISRRGFSVDGEVLWSAKAILEKPELLKQIHYDYYLAGADIVVSATYQFTFETMKKIGFEKDKSIELFHKGIDLVAEAREDYLKSLNYEIENIPLVGASIGSYAAFLADGSEYTGFFNKTKQELIDFHLERLELCCENPNTDIIALETMPSFLEAEALIEIFNSGKISKKAYISFACKNKEQINDGTLFADCVKICLECDNFLAIGINCTKPEFVPNLVDIANEVMKKQKKQKIIMCYPNLGNIWDSEKQTFLPDSGFSENDFVSLLHNLFINKKCSIVGGCCSTTPEIIKKLAELVKK
ncbi:hypothetical protein M0811_09114 [Anaeramoeba ignava]|uniref:Hcy-binding domain-containing protein n=1 Tax=Anaeramoeba ignava TaxID=1746090 RepID=A0A9Q0LIQ6_ANAIG|nr:hypothetical protein M0811_09114 [Anaeramoeba ignava]